MVPEVITHHLFGEDAAAKLPHGLIDGPEEMLAFLLANQGPDPFFCRFTTGPFRAEACHQLAKDWHAKRVVEALFAAREAAARLPKEDERVGRAFVLGMLAHYVLDSRAHAFVYAWQRALMTIDPSLAESDREVHAIIESEIDSWMLWSLRGQTVLDAPVSANLARTDRVVRVGGAIFSQVAMEAFDIWIGPGDYEGAVNDYELTLGLINPPMPPSMMGASTIERLLRGKSYLMAMRHPVQQDDSCPAANLEHKPWLNAVTGKSSTKSFGDLYYEALESWPTFAETFARGDQAAFAELTGGVNYNGDLVKE